MLQIPLLHPHQTESLHLLAGHAKHPAQLQPGYIERILVQSVLLGLEMVRSGIHNHPVHSPGHRFKIAKFIQNCSFQHLMINTAIAKKPPNII